MENLSDAGSNENGSEHRSYNDDAIPFWIRLIDERLEALTQSLELLASMHRDSEERTARLETAMAELSFTMNRLAKS